MTTIQEYVSYGIDKAELVAALETSVATMKAEWGKVLYVGIPNKSIYEPDGSPFGRQIKRAGAPVMLRRVRIEDGPVYFYKVTGGALDESWGTGNGNATLSPWDARELLRSDSAQEG